jgi:translation initiation factor IF-2
MSEDKQKAYRLFKVAKELNVASSTLGEFLKSRGHTIDENDPNVKISADMYDLLVKEYASDKKSKEKANVLKQQQKDRAPVLPKTGLFGDADLLDPVDSPHQTAEELRTKFLIDPAPFAGVGAKAANNATSAPALPATEGWDNFAAFLAPSETLESIPHDSPVSEAKAKLKIDFDDIAPPFIPEKAAVDAFHEAPKVTAPFPIDTPFAEPGPTVQQPLERDTAAPTQATEPFAKTGEKESEKLSTPPTETDTAPASRIETTAGDKSTADATAAAQPAAVVQPEANTSTTTVAKESTIEDTIEAKQPLTKTPSVETTATPTTTVEDKTSAQSDIKEAPVTAEATPTPASTTTDKAQNTTPDAEAVATREIQSPADTAPSTIEATTVQQASEKQTAPQPSTAETETDKPAADSATQPSDSKAATAELSPTEATIKVDSNTAKPTEVSKGPKGPEGDEKSSIQLKVVGKIDLTTFDSKKGKKNERTDNKSDNNRTDNRNDKGTGSDRQTPHPDKAQPGPNNDKRNADRPQQHDKGRNNDRPQQAGTDRNTNQDRNFNADKGQKPPIGKAARESGPPKSGGNRPGDVKPRTGQPDTGQKPAGQGQPKGPFNKDTPKATPVPTPTPVEPVSEVLDPALAMLPADVVLDPELIDDPEAEVIRAKDHAPKLTGLKVMGKIELPDPKKLKAEKELADAKDKGKIGGQRGGRPDNRTGKPGEGNRGPNQPATPGTSTSDAASEEEKRKRKRKRKSTGADGGGGDAAKPNTPAPNTGGNAPRFGPNKGPAGNNAKKGGVKPREEVDVREVKDNIRSTLFEINKSASRKRQTVRKEKRQERADRRYQEEQDRLALSSVIEVTEFLTANELASLMDVSVNQVIAKCMELGLIVSINQRINADIITLIAEEFGFEAKFLTLEESFETVDDDTEDDYLETRPPIVTVMGHVDHGKTSLLDYIRKANVIAGEAGGITQHIGAYYVTLENERHITFLDTPGHEAFTAMRARGAQVTDVAIIVIAADDQVMPQTREAINHAQAAGVPMVFAINKVDKPGALPDKIREQLAQMNLLVEEWGGKYQCQEISAKFGQKVEDLLEKVLLESDMLALQANPNRKGKGTVIEAELDKGRGVVATLLVQNGTLNVGDIVLANCHYGRIKAMMDERGRRIKKATPGMPVQILGLDGVPQAGDRFQVMETDREARELATRRQQLIREQTIRMQKHITLEEIASRSGDYRELNLIVKGDVDGSVEALADSLIKLSTAEVAVNIIMKGVGQISESDVNLAAASNAIIIGFQVRPSTNARKRISEESIDVRMYSVIYDAINEIKDALEGLLKPKIEEQITGAATVREVFRISKVGTIAGCYATEGTLTRNSTARLIRDGIVVHTGKIDSLKRFKEDVKEVKEGFECGISFENYSDIREGDIIETFSLREIKRTISGN